MDTGRRVTRIVLGLLAVAAGLGCCGLVAALLLDRTGTAGDLVSLLAWACGIGTVTLAVAAAQQNTDPDDDPRYLATVVHGLVDEWRR